MPKIKLPYTEEAEKLAEDLKPSVEGVGGEVIYPTSNAVDRVKTYHAGGEVGYNDTVIPQIAEEEARRRSSSGLGETNYDLMTKSLVDARKRRGLASKAEMLQGYTGYKKGGKVKK
jgi:hypothetical protein